MEVYLEVTYMINAMIILLVFELLCFLLNQQMTIKELIKYLLTYNISIIFLYIDFFDGFLLFYDLLLTFFYFHKSTYIYYPLFLFVYISIISFLEMILPSSTLFQGILIIEGIENISLFIMGGFVICICYLYIAYCKHHIQEHQFVDVSILDKKCLGFVDNGNNVFYKGYPVIFVTKELIGDYQKIDSIEIETVLQKEVIDIVMIDDIEINHQWLHHVYAGVMSSHVHDCILNSHLLGGML